MPPPNIASWMKAHRPKSELEKMLETPFYVVSDIDNTLTWKSVNGVKLNWSLNEDLTDAHELPADTTTEIPMQAGKKIYLFCTEDQPAFIFNDPNIGYECCNLKPSDATPTSIGGNVCFLSESSCFSKTNLQPVCRNVKQLIGIFSGNESIVDASNLVLAFSRLSEGCYQEMFNGCTAMKNGPQLNMTILTENCYNAMFTICTSLSNEQFLPATQLAFGCYNFMFAACPNVTDLHFPKSLENDATFLAMDSAPNFGAMNATVHFDL